MMHAARSRWSRAPRMVSAALIFAALGGAPTRADIVALVPTADNTMYSENGTQSNGAGNSFFAGRTDNAELRRGLLRFDLSVLPPGSTITATSLSLYCSRERSGTENIGLHRVLAAWGEGTSHASGEEGSGAAATTGDATWTYRLFSTQTWSTPGGDFVSSASATSAVAGQNAFYSWSGPGMLADAQAWYANPSSNFGWILIGNETVNKSTKRFESRQSLTTTLRPILTVEYTPPAGMTGACCLPSGSCVVTTLANCTAQGGTYQGDSVPCSPDPCGGGSQQVVLGSVRDNTLYESATGALSNGAGQGFIAGTSDNPILRRRGLVRFDISTIPSNATIVDARLWVYVGYTQATTADTISLHRATADWGEGTSNASGNETGGANSTTGDATWIHRIYNTVTWATAGGEFVASPSSSGTFGTTTGPYEWTGAGITADVQAWVSGTAPNYGWLVRGNEVTARSQRRLESRENADTTRRPTLTVTYTVGPPPPTGACCLPSGNCVVATQADCLSQGGTYQGDDTTCGAVNCPIILTPYVDALPVPGLAQPVTGQPGGAAHYVMYITEQTQSFHRDLPPTRVWGYNGSYPGPTILARTGLPITVQWVNDLRDEQGNLLTTHRLAVDTCLHGPDVFGSTPMVVTHLHGGHVDQDSDGYPEWYFPPGQSSPIYTYPNNQPAATIWYHDHALGITRLNVMMGLAGFYAVIDDQEQALNLPRGEFDLGLAVQDRSFNPDGTLKYPAMWMDHFIGDFLTVNGKVWPYLNVKQGKYRFRIVNGSTTRVYTFALSNGATFWQIGSDTGLLEAPIAMTGLTLTNGERAEVIVDFAPYSAGTEIVLTNSAPAPFPGDPGVGVIPNVMKFIVQGQPGDTDPLPSSLVTVDRIPEYEAVATRDFELYKISDECTGDKWSINGMMWDDVTEFPRVGDTEIWRWINRSGFTHPMHMHLVSFQVLDRQDFEIVNDQIVPLGSPVPPPANEMGWKDTVAAHPWQITRVIARFEGTPGRFAYHCHLLEHEEHEMMRQFMLICPSDLNQDGFVDPLDYNGYINAFESGDMAADFNLDGFLDPLDYNGFINAFEAGC